MTLRELERRLRSLNKNISIYATANESRPAGVWAMVPTYEGGEYQEMCGVEKYDVQEFPSYSPQGKMLKGGWHRVLTMLVGKGLIKRHESYKYFGHWDTHREPFIIFDKSNVDAAISQLTPIAYRKIVSPLDDKTLVDVPVYDNDDAVDIGRMIAKENKRTGPPPSTGTGLNLGA